MSRVLALVGPTAAGKTAVAVGLAERGLGGRAVEIVCVDSMTVYRGMDVGTAKPGPELRRRVPHHLLDIWDPAEPFSVAEFQHRARAAIHDVLARGATPLLVGGSGLYFRAVVDELEFPPTDPDVRAGLARADPDVLRARLKEADPDAAALIDPSNVRRVVRALEVIAITGRRFSDFRAGWNRFESRYPGLRVAGLSVSPDVLRARIELRADEMLARGLLDEVRGLLRRGYRESLTAAQAIAYREALAVIDGAMTEAEMREEVARATRRFARRQMGWFRRDPRVRWFDAEDLARAEAGIGAYYSEPISRGERRGERWSSSSRTAPGTISS